MILVKLPGIIVRSDNLPLTEKEAKHHGWRKAGHCKCDGRPSMTFELFIHDLSNSFRILICRASMGVETSCSMQGLVMPNNRNVHVLWPKKKIGHQGTGSNVPAP